MNRRRVLQMMAVPAPGALFNGLDIPLAAAEPVEPAGEATPALLAYPRLRFGCSFHFGMPNFTGDDYDLGRAPASTYSPRNLDVRQCVAHDVGAKYAILVAKYMSGFCLWPAKGYDYSVANSGNKTDVVSAFVDACNEYGLKAGFYYCILDPHNGGTFEKFDWDSLIPDHVFEIVKRQVAELHSLYPNTFYQLFDITWKLKPGQRWELYRLVKGHSPDLHHRQQPGVQAEPRKSGEHFEPASWPSDLINGEDTLPRWKDTTRTVHQRNVRTCIRRAGIS